MLLFYAIIALHVLVCFILILVVLLQSGKGADLAGAFGGGGTQTAFGSRGPASFLSKATTGAAIVFMLTSILLSGLNPGSTSKSILDGTKQTVMPATKAPAVPAPKGDVKVLTPEEIKKQQEEIELKAKQAPVKPAEQPAAPAGKQAPAPVPTPVKK
jgi:preprotein translocase subunit SecG